MRVIVDGLVYDVQKYGGVNTYFNELLPRLARDHRAQVRVLLSWRSLMRIGAVGEPPKAPVRVTWRNALPTGIYPRGPVGQYVRKLCERTNASLLARRIGKLGDAVFHSTYYTCLNVPFPQVATVYDLNHELFPEASNGVHRAWMRAHFRDYVESATRIIAISEKTKADLVRLHGVDASRISVVYLAVDREAFWPDKSGDRASLPPEMREWSEPYLLYVGARAGYKNFPLLLEAFAGLPNDVRLRLVCAGNPWTEDEERRILEAGAASRVHLVVRPAPDLLRKLYSGSAAFIYPSLSEGFGIPLLEAMACGTMVLASDIPVFREVAGNAPLYFDPSSAEAVRAAIGKCLDQDLRTEHVHRALEHVGNYSWRRCAEETHAVYQQALQEAS